MAKFGGRAGVKAAIAISAAGFLLTATADVAFSDDLKGYSIDLLYTSNVVPGAVIAGEMPKYGLTPAIHHERIYISVLGNVFIYSDAAGGAFGEHGAHETQLDKAKTVSRERMSGWTVEAGRLIRIEKTIEGLMVDTFTVDFGASACNYSVALQPDAKTGRVVLQLLNRMIVEVKAYNVSATTCAVRKGNVFASDQ